MDTKIFNDKFSMVDRLAQFVWWLTWNNCNEEHPMMNSQDLHSELQMELIKGIQCYPCLPEEQLVAVLKRMLDNRVAELIHRFYGTHRKVEKFTISMTMSYDAPDDTFEKEYSGGMEITDNCTPTPEELYASKERVERTKARLQPMARRVLDYMLNDSNTKLANILCMAMLRAQSKFSSPHVSIKPRHVAEAMCLPERTIKQSFREISAAYMAVLQEC